MKNKILSIIMILFIGLCFLPINASGLGDDYLLISNKKYNIAPDVVEYERITNNSELSSQLVGHVMEVTLGGSAEIVVGYNDYNIDAIKSGKNWGMKKTTEQAQAIETRNGYNVVGAVNGDFFNMSNGEPTGTVVMQSQVVKNPDGKPFFYIDADGKPHIETENLYSLPEGVKEAINLNHLLVNNGEALPGDNVDNPRTAIGIKADGTVVIYMLNGRQAPYSVGATLTELAVIMKDLGCVVAGNLDGGGSSTFATQREGEDNDNEMAGLTVRCRPSDGYERSVSTTIMVISKASKTGEFDHASISPSEDIYTPGSEIQFSAIGVDSAGGAAPLPESGLKWTIVSGSELGTIDENTGLFVGTSGATGAVTVGLKYNDEIVGESTVELQIPDKLAFNNTSVSLDFGEESDLTFIPSYKGRDIKYKDGDFTWELDAKTYKYITLIETKAANSATGYAGNGVTDFKMTLNGQVNVEQKLEYSAYGTWWNRATGYMETSKTVSYDENGDILVTSVVKNTKYWTFEYVKDAAGTIIGQNSIEHTDNLQADQQFTFSIGKFTNNKFIAHESNSLRGTVTVKYGELSSSIDVIVGMEPFVIMDFEDKTDSTGNTISATDYWKTHVGGSGGKYSGSNGQLSIDEMKQSKLWIRDTTGKGVLWPTDALGNEMNGIVSSEENSNVRFGDYAMQLAWDFTKIDVTTVAVADFGFSAIVYVNEVQPTKMGMWINVPEELVTDNSVIKAILVGNGVVKDSSTLAYHQMNEDGTLTLIEGKNISGTTSYVQYYSYDTEGNVTGSQLKDWAGKGWTWVEANISSFQMPIGIQRGYSVRITSPQNSGYIEDYDDAGNPIINRKGSGSILIDNFQLIYGTNTNDINKPEISTLTERTSGQDLRSNAVFETEILNFEMTFTDNLVTDKYATGIDEKTIKAYIDGYDMTNSLDITAGGGSAYLYNLKLKNGIHNIKVRVKDVYGNETIETYFFTVNDPNGTSSQITVVPIDEKPIINKEYKLKVFNNGEEVENAEVSIAIADAYKDSYSVVAATGYEIVSKLDGKNIVISITKKEGEAATSGDLAYITFNIPADSLEGDSFKYSVPSGKYILNNESIIFADTEKSNKLYAEYDLTIDSAICGFESILTVKDSQGNKISGVSIYSQGVLIGSTDETGELKHVFTETGRITLYANDENWRSWNVEIVVNTVSTENEGKPFGIQPNGVDDGSSKFNVTWLTAIGKVKEVQSYIRYSNVYKTAEGLANNVSNVLGQNELITFTQSTSGDAFRINSVTLTNLLSNTTYFYQVGTEVDGQIKWSDVLSFTTASDSKDSDTNFFVLGDVQSNDTANLSVALNMINYNANQAGYKMNFGLQTGDAIDNVTVFNNWRSFLTTVNAEKLNGVSLIRALGNHEYYGDNDGLVSGAMYGLSQTKQGSFHSYEYGSVYVGIINNGGNILEAIEELKKDVANTECSWKVVVTHEPIYGTESFLEESTRLQVAKGLEEAGVDIVFTGDDHAYARTYPLKGDKIAENPREGVVYYVVGDLSSKDNSFANGNNELFAYSKPHVEYLGMYLQVKATREEITITAVQYNGEIPYDIYTIRKTDCELGNHTYNEESKYDLVNKTINCAVCGGNFNTIDEEVTGKYETSDGIGNVMLVLGELKTGWFPFGEEMLHAAEDGILHATETEDTATCLETGHIIAKCECGAHYVGEDATWNKGHTWDENYVCEICGVSGISIVGATITIEKEKYSYTGQGVTPLSSAVHTGLTLKGRSDRYGTDAYISYNNNVNVGIATLIWEGRGNYYDSVSTTFIIVPADVTGLKATNIERESITLKWDVAGGATNYLVYISTGDEWKLVDNVTDTSITVDNLDSKTEYMFKVIGRATVDNVDYESLNNSDILSVTTLDDNSINFIDILSVAHNNINVHMKKAENGNYIFLPSSADLTDLQLNFILKGSTDKITLVGNKATLVLNSYEEKVNLDNIASKDGNGNYLLEVIVGTNAPFDLKVLQGSVKSMYLTSAVDGEDREWVDSSKSNSTTGLMILTDEEGNEIYNGELSQIKARGNSTFVFYDKKSYQIKLTSKTDIFGNGENVKTLVLLAGYGDATQMHDKIFKDLATALSIDYAASCDWVDLYYDGEYLGIYLLSEKVSVGADSVNITDLEDAYLANNPNYGENMTSTTSTNKYGQTIKYTEGLFEADNLSGGYLIELNHNYIDEASGFNTIQGVSFNVKSPEYIGKDAMSYISEYYQEFENAVFAKDEEGNFTGYNVETGKYYYDYVDLDSLVKMFLIQDFARNCDAFVSSLFFYKDVNGKMYVGPVWDMEMAFGTGWVDYYSSENEYYAYLASALSNIEGFKEAVKEFYTSTFGVEIRKLIANDGSINEYLNLISESAEMNYELWPLIRIAHPQIEGHEWPEKYDHTAVVETMKEWIGRRIDYMNKKYCNHTYAEKWSSNSNGHWHACTICGLEEEVIKHTPGAAATETTPQVCTVCNYEIQKAIGHIHRFSTTYSKDANQHWYACSGCAFKYKAAKHVYDNDCDTTCNTCGYERTITHTYATEWSKDITTHYHACTVCGDKKDVANHEFDNGCDTTCNTCGYERITEHKYEAKFDANKHWLECSVCKDKKDEANHEFDNDCDPTCNGCSYVREIEHKHEAKFDANKHWSECSVCKDKKDEANHTFDNDCDPTCNGCSYVREIEHKHEAKFDANKHWSECSVCKDKKDEADHTFDNDCDPTCNGCSYVREIEHKHGIKHDDVKHWYECSVCKDKKDEANHTWDEGVVTKEPSNKEEGITTFTCDICGATREESIAMTGCKSGAIQSVFYMLSVLGLAFILRKRKMF